MNNLEEKVRQRKIPPPVKFKDAIELFENMPGYVMGFFGGSRVICLPPPTDTDRDIVLRVLNVEPAAEYLLAKGWELPKDREEYPGEYGSFVTMRKGEDNVMLFEDPREYGAVLAATCIAMQQNLMEKSQRYKLFEIARGYWR
ncbi:hypothetical protein HOR19_gp24 [Phage MedPE-SWcel-C56]|uniref:Uncharacterized protein n=1 Tax=Phage MedPE-SWcel-C56 TaxID=1871314 RepID=A0A1B1IY39_9CAUD|nr:hypothetical protein HOR19_gp24 [Phage MedPE-SWcel-C56]ANS06217.1 hypothetical protein [Phage MedPE-SWcel-C56]